MIVYRCKNNAEFEVVQKAATSLGCKWPGGEKLLGFTPREKENIYVEVDLSNKTMRYYIPKTKEDEYDYLVCAKSKNATLAWHTSHKKETRPNRSTIISEDDITNLKITLGTTTTVDEFIKEM